MNLDRMTFAQGTRALVIGLGRSGRASLEVLRKRGASVFVTDESAQVLSNLHAELTELGVTMISPDALSTHLSGLDVAILSPGVPLTSPVVCAIQDARIPVLSEIEVAYRLSQAPIIAVTGTKGKTTTTALTGALLRSAGHETYIGGNIGNALIGETAHAPREAWVVAEVSSFQLETIRSFQPRIATILNLSPDHLDRYHSMEEYTEAKYRIFANQSKEDIFVGNLDDPAVAVLAYRDAGRLPGKSLWFALEPKPRASIFVKDERILWFPVQGCSEPVDIMPVAEIPLPGRHNVANVLAALLLGLAVGCDPERLREGVKEFRALSHRLEPVAEIDGIRYLDDSKATNPGSVVAALAAVQAPVLLIAGGKAKRTDFREMGRAIEEYTRAVILIGEAADEIAETITKVPVYRASSMEEAVACAASLARAGDVVLLSPGCASFDMFSSAEARGDAFATAVKGSLR